MNAWDSHRILSCIIQLIQSTYVTQKPVINLEQFFTKNGFGLFLLKNTIFLSRVKEGRAKEKYKHDSELKKGCVK